MLFICSFYNRWLFPEWRFQKRCMIATNLRNCFFLFWLFLNTPDAHQFKLQIRLPRKLVDINFFLDPIQVNIERIIFRGTQIPSYFIALEWCEVRSIEISIIIWINRCTQITWLKVMRWTSMHVSCGIKKSGEVYLLIVVQDSNILLMWFFIGAHSR